MTPALLRLAGETLFGPRWQRPLAKALGVGGQTVWRWSAGLFNVPADLPGRLVEMLRERRRDCSVLIRAINKLADNRDAEPDNDKEGKG